MERVNFEIIVYERTIERLKDKTEYAMAVGAYKAALESLQLVKEALEQEKAPTKEPTLPF